MVKSEIEKSIVYSETKIIDNEDKGHSSSIYSVEIEGEDIEVAIGKEKYTYSEKNVISYPIYVILNNQIKERIGIYEIESNDLITALDEDGDIDLSKGNILFFSYISKSYITNLKKENEIKVEVEVINNNSNVNINDSKEDDNEDVQEDDEEDGEEDDEEDVTKVSNIKNNLSKVKEEEELKDGIFIENEKMKKKALLKEEFEKDSRENKEKYEEKPNIVWISKFLKNNNYDIIDNDGSGDCFFMSIRDAFELDGKMTTIKKLRALLSKKATDEQYMQYKGIYQSMKGEINTKERNMKELRKTGKMLKTEHEKTTIKEEGEKILKRAKENVAEYEKEEMEKKEAEELMEEFSFMEGVDSYEKFREVLKTRDFWADTWAITTLEDVLKIKIIILSEESYYSGDLDSVMLCGQLNDDKNMLNSTPEHYVMVSYTGNHYKLITYKEKGLLKFTEIPYDIKMLVINKCMERNSGPYYLLKDFRELKMNLGLSSDEGNKDENEYIDYELFDNETVFMFYNKSDPKPKAGKGSGESIKDGREIEFNKLNKDNTLKDWRRKLDDSWKASFELDGKKWATVDHYYYGSQFKKGYPDFYNKFSLDSNSDLSLDPKKAKAAASTKGKYEKKLLRPAEVKHDPDFFEIGPEQRSKKERKDALNAKFTQNQDMKKVLLETKDAKLVKFIRSNPPEIDIELMEVRKILKNFT